MEPDIATAQRKVAHALWVELTTRIATQRLPFRSGDEESAAKSLFDLFATTRKLMTDNPGAPEFLTLAEKMLNKVIRPRTARWHEWMTADATERDRDGKPALKFRDEWVRKQFRRELRALQPHLVGFKLAFDAMKDGKTPEAWWTAKDKTKQKAEELRALCHEPMEAVLGQSLPAGIVSAQMRFKGLTREQQAALVATMNEAEHEEIRDRHGRAPGQVETFEFSDLENCKKEVSQARAGVTVSLVTVRKNVDVYEVRLRVKFEKADQAFESYRGWVYSNAAYLLDAQGQRIDNDGLQTAGGSGGNEIGAAYVFAPDHGLQGCKLVYKTPAVLVKMPVRFTLKDIPLP